MGQKTTISMLKKEFTITLPYSDYDKLIHLQYEFIKGKINKKELKKYVPLLNIDYIKEIKSNDAKSVCFLSWYDIWMQNDEEKKSHMINANAIPASIPHLFFSTYQSSFIVPIFNHNNSNINSKYVLEISECEKGFRKYYSKSPKKFKTKVFEGSSSIFRWLSWLICSDIPIERSVKSYCHLSQYKLKDNIETQINKDILRTMTENEITIPELHKPLFRILKALALLDPEMSYCQGMNFISGFMLLLSDGNEIDTFYLLMALFSNTFNSSYSLRGFFIESFPKLYFYAFVFNHLLEKNLSGVYNHFNSIDLFPDCWVIKWFQTLYVHIFPFDCTVRIWDGIFAFGLTFIISVALSIVTLFQKELMSTFNLEDVVEFFRRLNPKYYHIKEKELEYDIEKILLVAKTRYIICNEEIEMIRELYIKEESDYDKVVLVKTYDYLNVNENQFIVGDEELNKINECLKDVEKESNDKNIILNINNTIKFNNPFIKK